MIITLKGADFSASNIGTLSSWRISRSLGSGATYEGVTSVEKGASFNATVTIADGYEIGAAGVTITMDGAVLNGAHSISGNVITITIASVTGNVAIKVPTQALVVEPEIPEESTYYTITYKYVDSSGATIKANTTETVVAGTIKTFSTSNAAAINDYTVSSVSPQSATVNTNITVTYTYIADMSEIPMGGSTNESTEGATWYLSHASQMINNGTDITSGAALNTSVGAFAFADAVNSTLINKPINLMRCFVNTSGTMTFYRWNKIEKTLKPVQIFNLSNPGSTLQTFKFATPLTLASDEYLAFSGKEDTGKIYYYSTGLNGLSTCKLTYGIEDGNTTQTATAAVSTGLDIGYIA